MANELSVYRGDTASITVTIVDSDGAAFDLTGYTTKLTVKNSADDNDAHAVIGPITATVATPASGIGIFALSITDTDVVVKEYVYDVQINDGSTDKKTVTKRTFTVTQDVTKA